MFNVDQDEYDRLVKLGDLRVKLIKTMLEVDSWCDVYGDIESGSESMVDIRNRIAALVYNQPKG